LEIGVADALLQSGVDLLYVEMLMEKNADEQAVARNAARGAMRAERAARREAVSAVGGMPGKLGRKAVVMLMGEERFGELVEEKGGEEGFMRFLCAQVSSGVSGRVVCEHYGVEYGLLGSWLSEDAVRLERYYRAQSWAAEGLVEGALDEAWGDGLDVVRSKLRVDTNMRVAGKWNRARFGDKVEVEARSAPVINFVMGEGSAVVVGPALPSAERVLVGEAVEQVIEPEMDDPL